MLKVQEARTMKAEEASGHHLLKIKNISLEIALIGFAVDWLDWICDCFDDRYQNSKVLELLFPVFYFLPKNKIKTETVARTGTTEMQPIKTSPAYVVLFYIA